MNRIIRSCRRGLAMFLCLVLIIGLLPVFALGADDANHSEDKFEADLIEAMRYVSDTEKIPVWIWLQGYSTGYFDALVEQEYGPEPAEGCTMSEAQAYLEARRAIIRRECVAYNEQFLAEVLPEISESELRYLGKYTTSIVADLTKAEITKVASDERVNSLSLYKNYEAIEDEADKTVTIQDQIRADYYATLKDPETQPEDVYVKQYYGCWGGYHVVLMENEHMLKLDEVLYLNVAGFTFEFPSISDKSLFLAWRDGEFTPVKEAYEKGLLTVKNVYELYLAFYKNAQPPCFLDVRNDRSFYFAPVYWAYGAKITQGVDKNHFGPDKGCTRGQVVTFLWRAAGEPEPEKTENPFTDVKEGAFYYTAVLWAVETGVTKGATETTFAPDATCTRGQIVTFLYRAKGSPELTKKENPFKDVADGQYYAEAVAWAVENNVTKGKSSDTFDPNATCTRGEVVTFLYRAMGEK